MVSNSKILTVSYGTFSCTLEGFDDPFSTMKSIAEYFRDLAADDRYFGAEPPQPDAEMLHRIAEREIHRRVEARLEPGGVVLRPVEDEPAKDEPVGDATGTPDATARALLAGEAPADTDDTEDHDHRDEAPDTIPATEELREEDGEPHPVPAALREPAASPPDSIAAKLKRIREVVERRQAARGGDDFEDPLSDDFYAEAMLVEEMLPEDRQAAPITELDEEFEAGEPAAAPLAEAPVPGERAEALESETAPAPLRAEDADEADGGEEGEDDDHSIAAVLGAVARPDANQPDAGEEVPDFDDEDSLISGAWDESPQATEEDGDAEETADNVFAVAAEEGDDKEAAEIEPGEDEPAEIEPEERPIPSARIVHVRRRPAPVAADDADSEDEDEEDEAEDEVTSLSPEDEAELMAELAEVERDAEKEAREAERAQARAVLDKTAPDEDAVAVDRLLAETNTKLETGEATRRRSAIAHLRAAVQAKLANQDIKGPDTVETAEGFREDLARVVRPRRLATGDGAPRRLAPLVLVSEQRIDAPDRPQQTPAPAAPVRPRRITKGNLALDTVEEDVAEQDVGDALCLGVAMALAMRAS